MVSICQWQALIPTKLFLLLFAQIFHSFWKDVIPKTLNIFQKLLQCFIKKPKHLPLLKNSLPVSVLPAQVCHEHILILSFHTLSPFCSPIQNLPTDFHQSLEVLLVLAGYSTCCPMCVQNTFGTFMPWFTTDHCWFGSLLSPFILWLFILWWQCQFSEISKLPERQIIWPVFIK